MDYGKVAYVGGGNMARALAGGMLAAGYEPSHLWISEPAPEQRARLADELPGAVIVEGNEDAVRDAECVLLAVKPQILADVCKPLAGLVQQSRPLVISIAAGVRARDIEDWLGGSLPVVRVMPNQPALLRLGISGLYATSCGRRPTSFPRPDPSSRSAARKISTRSPPYPVRGPRISTCSSTCS